MNRFAKLSRPIKIGLASITIVGSSLYGYQRWQEANPPPETRPPTKGYKAFNPNMTCIGFQYKVGQTYTLPKDQKPELCSQGFHFCEYPPDCNLYYHSDDSLHAEVEAWDVLHDDNTKSVAGKLRVVRMIPKDEWQSMTGTFVTTSKTVYLKDGKLHREDGPAYQNVAGTTKWYRHDELHRDDGPAVEYADGTKEWWREGIRYTEDGKQWPWNHYLYTDY